MLVPLMLTRPLVPASAETMSTPGAAMSAWLLAKSATRNPCGVCSKALTATMPVAAAGGATAISNFGRSLSLPLAATIRVPWPNTS